MVAASTIRMGYLVIRSIKFALVPGLAGLALDFSFRHNIWWLAIIAIGILYRRLADQALKVRLRVVAIFATAFFVAHVWWISVLGVDALLLLAALCIFFFSLICVIPIQSGSLSSKLEFAALWAFIELLRSSYPWGGFSWGLLGYSQTSGPIVQYARVGNFALVAFVMVLIATLASEQNLFGKFWQKSLLLMLIVAGYIFPATDVAQYVSIAVVQGGVASDLTPGFAKPNEVFLNHLAQTRSHVSALRKTDIVVWPENSVILQSGSAGTERQIQEIVNEIGKPFLIGAVRNGLDGRPENVVTLWLPEIGQTESYVKNHLVPFGEYLPVRSLLAPHINRFDQIPNDFVRGKGAGVMDVSDTKVGVAICFEVSDQPHLTSLVNDGAEIFVAASNNATYLGTQQPLQQFEISRFSAIAHERSMVIATTSGVSGVVSANGEVSNLVTQKDGEVFVAKVGLSNAKSIADRFASAQIRIFGVLVIFLALRRLRTRVQSRQRNRSEQRA